MVQHHQAATTVDAPLSHGMKTRDRNKSVVHELLSSKKKPSPSDSVRKRQAGDEEGSIFGPEVVGRKVAVYWRKPGQWFKGKIYSYTDKTKKHFVKYEDGDQQEVDLAREKFQFLTQPKPGAAPNSSYHGSPKGKDAVGRKVKVYWPAMGRWYVGKVKEYDKPSGKHLIAYQDGEQQLVLLRNEAVKYPHIEAQKAKDRAMKMQKKKQKVKQGSGNKKGGSPGHGARTLPRGKRVAADCQNNNNDSSVHSEYTVQHVGPGGKQPTTKRARSSKPGRQGETSHNETVTTSSMELDSSTCVSGNSSDNDSNDSMRNVQCPKTPDHDLEEAVANQVGLAPPLQLPVELVEVGEANKKDMAVVEKAELAKAKAMKAKEIAARKAEAAAKALAAAEAAQKAEAHDKPQGKDAVGWRLRVWSPEEHKYFKGVVIGFNQGSGEHKLKFDNGQVDSVVLDQQRTKWLNKTIPEALKKPASQSLATNQKLLPLKDTRDLVGKHVRIHRGHEKLVGKVVAFSPSRQKYLILFVDSKHEWSDLKRNNWQLHDSSAVTRPSYLPQGMDALGWRVAVYWPERERFYQGRIMNFEPTSGHYLVQYEEKMAEQQVWLNLSKEDVKWLPVSSKHVNSKAFKSGNVKKGPTQGGREELRVFDEEALDLMSCHPEFFAHCPGSNKVSGVERSDVLSNIHNAWGLLTPLEELSSRNKANKSNANALPVHSVDDVWGVKIVEPMEVERDQGAQQEAPARGQGQALETRLALSHRLQVLEFMAEHSSHAQQCLGGLTGEDQPLLNKEDIQPLEPAPSLSNFSF
ncbi:hypothetical protein HOP50_02g19320 [Chloropicon primus]|uniref:Tudor domain-containing protein n=1 Tax=Chloropicon primus TaxID=1764295 RepID=A0A5B8MG98_9CHLO|nr:hypothetical protein A3770_02p19350 [Chloropicon primus]UPQ98626.1 hypothetical protein HOP50_02g19320 [Chloropicon primus]|mmetsp:Transcript_2773/g.7593  ORF Transcript_2773/g.7593 Transcript_2773/m.7593 type:complete len:802 (+) Transcript_2773:460-2865(+)|eukprot:QDZ19417.1 hypothetical protein A3770_02p19350 [Chloropicon primus]